MLSVHIVTIFANTVCKYTVNKLRSINLLFSGMFGIERKVVNVGTEKIHTLYITNKFTLNWKILSLLLLMRKITKIFICTVILAQLLSVIVAK